MTKRAFTVDTGLEPHDTTVHIGTTGAKFTDLHLSSDANVGGNVTVTGNITASGTITGAGSGLTAAEAIAYSIALG